ncbi:MAG: DNA ligase [Desulfuromonadaceae bacterium]|nr:DNA ligase [Desulfuromonadaceae bacterium]
MRHTIHPGGQKKSSLVAQVVVLGLALAVVLAVQKFVWAQEHVPMLPREYRGALDVSGWWMSEKLDGVRAYWDGEQLYSKNGFPFNPPPEFVAELPPFALEGELWGGRDTFVQTIATVLQQQPHPGWLELKFMIFDVPAATPQGSFRTRLGAVVEWFSANPATYARLVEQVVVEDPAHLSSFLDMVEGLGGEGLIVRDPEAVYAPGRSDSILKVKRFQDAEATAIGYVCGRGRNAGRLGALVVRSADGTEFKIGSGFTDSERENPPDIGSIVTYKYHGFHASGIPKFPVYVRVRSDSHL